MTIKHETLPGGAWADLRDPSEIPERLRRPIRVIQMKLARDPAFAGVVKAAQAKGVEAVKNIDEAEAAAMATQMGDESAAALDDLNDRLILARVMGWSYGPEVTADALLDLPGPAYDRLKELCAEGALDSAPDFSPSQDPDSPTTPSIA